MARWGMVIDLLRCNGCYSCVMACKQENFLPAGILWNRVLVGESGKYPTVTKEILPILCNHCKEAACVNACPTGATARREDGVVTIDYDKCIGCRYCIIACPFQARSYLHKLKEYFPGQGRTPWDILAKDVFQTGVAVKCDFCSDRIDAGLKKGLKPGVDREATPACVLNCPTKARYFGDLDDPNSEVSRLIKEERATQFHPEYGTEPSVYYIK
jgi:phenylacetyl-CoA:acceptor oxidoreductase subunit 1